MQITNHSNLPQSLVNACGTEKHNAPGCVSATTLIQGTKKILLSDRHWDEMSEDVSDRIWAIEGTVFHKVLEENNPGAFTEERFELKVGSKTVTGQVDLYDMERKMIVDYKRVSVYKILRGDFEEWRKQGLIYAYLLKQAGLEVKKCQFLGLIRDWKKSEAKHNPDYPRTAIYRYEFDVTEKDLEEIKAFIEMKVADIEANENKPDDEIPECSESERWSHQTIWAVMKKGRKSAVNARLTDRAEAEAMAATIDGGYVEERKGASARCEDYCSCCSWCKFYKENCQGGEDNGESAA